MKKIKIIGCGSLLSGDDAVGCIIARELKKLDLPESVTVIEAGTPGLDLLNLMEPGDRVIIVDAVVTGQMEIGDFMVFSQEQLPRPTQMPVSAHHIAIPEAIALGYKIQPELMPDSIEIWGIEIKAPLVRKMELSGDVKKAIPLVVEKLKEEFS